MRRTVCLPPVPDPKPENPPLWVPKPEVCWDRDPNVGAFWLARVPKDVVLLLLPNLVPARNRVVNAAACRPVALRPGSPGSLRLPDRRALRDALGLTSSFPERTGQSRSEPSPLWEAKQQDGHLNSSSTRV